MKCNFSLACSLMSRGHNICKLQRYEILFADKSHTYLNLGYEVLSYVNNYKPADRGRCMTYQGPIQIRNAFEQCTDFYFLTGNVGTFKDSMLHYCNISTVHLLLFSL